MNDIDIQLDSIELKGLIATPQNAKGLILFAHGSGSSRLSPRNQFVANYLVQIRCTLLHQKTRNNPKCEPPF